MRPLCLRTSCSKSKGEALRLAVHYSERRGPQHTLAATERPLLAKVSLWADGLRSEPDRQRSTQSCLSPTVASLQSVPVITEAELVLERLFDVAVLAFRDALVCEVEVIGGETRHCRKILLERAGPERHAFLISKRFSHLAISQHQ